MIWARFVGREQSWTARDKELGRFCGIIGRFCDIAWSSQEATMTVGCYSMHHHHAEVGHGRGIGGALPMRNQESQRRTDRNQKGAVTKA